MLPQPLPAHPRLFASLDDWKKIRERIKFDPISARLWTCVRHKADRFLNEPSITRQVDGLRLLAQSRLCIEHVVTLAAAARISGDKRYATRAINEMRAVAQFPDWNPSHFLDVAEMAAALAIGFDWLHDFLSIEDRNLIAASLIDKALLPSYDDSVEFRLWWISGTNNWNQVCHAGVSLAAIAVAEMAPELAERTLRRAIENIPKAAHSYAPDGAYAEGPAYWDYGTTYHVLLAAALEHFTASTHGLDKFPGFQASAEYMMEVTSPMGCLYGYADSEEKRFLEIPLFWFARRFQRPDFLQYELTHLEEHLSSYEQSGKRDDSRFLALALIWRDTDSNATSHPAPPLNWCGRGVNPVAVFRSAWDDPKALFAGIKGGSPRDPHAHMDAGSFILEADGVRWALDLDKQDYHSLEVHGLELWGVEPKADRWKIFRFGSASHNIMRFDGANQCVAGRAEIIRFKAEGPRPHAIVNLDSIYADQVRSARRGLAVLPDRCVLIQDEWSAGDLEVQADWQFLTRAEVILDGNRLTLLQDGQNLALEILEPKNVRVEVVDVSKPTTAYDAPNPGLRRIHLRTSTPSGESGRFRVLAIPGDNAIAPEAPAFAPLDKW